jgi:aryl-alcohol dehydrogenase-like predicted oxidoreductase
MAVIGERRLGRSGITVPALGVGTNRWGGRPSTQAALNEAFAAAIDVGVGSFDTAEIYTGGKSERAIGQAAKEDGRPAFIASKFAPFPYRLTASQFSRALDRSLARLGRDSIDLYYVHFPFSPVGLPPWIRAMAEAVRSGRIRAVGVSNCSASQMKTAAAVLERYDVPLAANQVQYSPTHRQPENNGVLEACRDMDVALVAYRPISGGSISGRGSAGGGTLSGVLGEVAQAHDATVIQVALSWLLHQDEHVIAIPGATKAAHVRENAAALALGLSDEEVRTIATAAD